MKLLMKLNEKHPKTTQDTQDAQDERDETNETDEAWNGPRSEPLSTAATAAISIGTLVAAVVARALLN